MAYETKTELTAETTITLGGTNQKTGKPDPKSVEGYYLGSRATPDKGYGPGVLHFFQTSTGNVGVWGKTRLNNGLTPDLIGVMCLVTCKGKSPKVPGRNPAFLFEIKFDRSNTIEVSTDAPGATYEEDGDAAEGDTDDGVYLDEGDAGEEDAPIDEVQPRRPTPPVAPRSTANADARKADVRRLLNRKSA